MNALCTCSCCSGATGRTPESKANRPGLRAITHRAGTHATFRDSLLSRLSTTDFPALAGLTTRSDNDWTIGFLDAFAVLGDVVTFYQERIANEAFLNTARERRSVVELARLVGYWPAPGVAASTALAFTLDAPLVQPTPPPLPVTVPAGARVQSIPGPGEDAQTFETVGPIVARAEWNAMPVQTAERVAPHDGQTVLWLKGVSTGLQKGDALILVGAAREVDKTSNAWCFRLLRDVSLDEGRGLTRVSWTDPVAGGTFPAPGDPEADATRVFALRQRAALFGHNAPDPNLVIPSNLPEGQRSALVTWEAGGPYTWKAHAGAANSVDLDAVYPKIVAPSWVALIAANVSRRKQAKKRLQRLRQVIGTTELSLNAYAMSAKVSRLTLEAGVTNAFDVRTTTAFGQSEELRPSERPLFAPLFGRSVPLASVEPLLAPGQTIAVRGRRQRIAVPAEPVGIVFVGDAGRSALPRESFVMLAPPVLPETIAPLAPGDVDPETGMGARLHWTVLDRDGATVALAAAVDAIRYEPPRDDDPVMEEIAVIDDAPDSIRHDRDRTRIRLKAPLRYTYDRATVRVNANVAAATHGETVGEIAGSGDAALSNQRFLLRQHPLTYVAAENPRGAASTLTVTVGDQKWIGQPALFERPANARVYSLRQQDDGRTVVQFGDGTEGARLPTGQDNVRLTYRKGLGVEGNVRAGTLTTLLSRPLGVKASTNPEPASGGEDPEPIDDLRINVPLGALIMERVVSLDDYTRFARAFAGIAKASAIWIGEGTSRGVHLTVAGVGGAPVAEGSRTRDLLLTSLRNLGDANLPLTLQSYVPATFALEAKIRVEPLLDAVATLAAAEAELRAAYGFDAREFSEPVTRDGVIAAIHRVAGVVAVDIERLHRTDLDPGAGPEARIFPALARVQSDGSIKPAELLTLDPADLVLGKMT